MGVGIFCLMTLVFLGAKHHVNGHSGFSPLVIFVCPVAHELVEFGLGLGELSRINIEGFKNPHYLGLFFCPGMAQTEKLGGVFEHGVGALFLINGGVGGAPQYVVGHPPGVIEAHHGFGVEESSFDMFGEGFAEGLLAIARQFRLGALVEKSN